MKVSDLEGVMLDYWVAKAEGHPFKVNGEFSDPRCWIGVYLDSIYEQSHDASLIRAADWVGGYLQFESYDPSMDWGWAGPIIERERIMLTHVPGGESVLWLATADSYATDAAQGPTPLIAAMRAYVISKLGDEVPEQ